MGFQKGNKYGCKPSVMKGKTIPEERKRRISNTMKGRMPSNLSLLNANKTGKGNPMYGRHPSKETLAKRSKSLLEHWASNNKRKEETAKRFLGENNPRWRGGITPELLKIRNSKEYILWRVAVFMRDDYTCQSCGERGVKLQAHHIKPFSTNPELRFAIDNGQTLCVSCHKITSDYGWKMKHYAFQIS